MICHLCCDQRVLSLSTKLYVDDLHAQAICIKILKGLIYNFSKDFNVASSIIPESILRPKTDLLTDCKVNLLNIGRLILVSQEVVKLANTFLMQFILNRESELNLLTNIILELKWSSSGTFELIKVEVDLGLWECDKALGGTEEVPTVVIDLHVIDLF